MELEILYQLIALLSFLPLLGFIGSGAGTEGDPYLVTSVDELNDVRNELTAFYRLENDLDLGAETDNSGGSYWNGGSGWDPIGGSGSPFTGNFDGNGFTIDGLFINRDTSARLGLFGVASTGSVIENLTLSNVDITTVDTTNSRSEAGAFVGGLVNGAIIRECKVDGGSVTAERNAGGFVAEAEDASVVERCENSATIETTVSETTFGSGGIIGRTNDTSQINDCKNTGEIRGINLAGGVAGYMAGDSQVNRSFSTGTITDISGGGSASHLGGLIGRFNFAGSVNDSFWDTQTSGMASSDGGTGKTTAEMQDVATFTDTTTTGLDNAWDFVGTLNDDAGTDDYWDINASEYPHLTALVDVPAQPISGTIEDEQGNPVENAIVKIFTEVSLEDQTAPTFVEAVLTDANGEWEMQTAYDETLSYKVEYKKFIADVTGTADSATSSSLTDAGAFTAGQFDDGEAIIKLTGGTGSGQERRVTGNADTDTVDIDGSWGTTPDATTTYEVGYMYSDELKFKPPKSAA